MLGADMKAVDVVQGAVVGLTHHGQCPDRVAHPVRSGAPLDDRVVHDTDAVGVRDADRSGKHAVLADPLKPRQLSVAVEPMRPGEYRFGPDVTVMRDHHGHAGADGAFTDAERSVPAHERRVPDANAAHVGDRVQRSGLHAPDTDSDVAGSCHAAESSGGSNVVEPRNRSHVVGVWWQS
jgi:hypothetical protein